MFPESQLKRDSGIINKSEFYICRRFSGTNSDFQKVVGRSFSVEFSEHDQVETDQETFFQLSN